MTLGPIAPKGSSVRALALGDQALVFRGPGDKTSHGP